jgi:hypothetical protein
MLMKDPKQLLPSLWEAEDLKKQTVLRLDPEHMLKQ